MTLTIKLITIILCFISTAFAHEIKSVKGNRALIEIDTSELDLLSVGQEVFAINNESGNKAALLKIKQIKDTKAIAEILKGKVKPGFTLQDNSKTESTTESTTETTTEPITTNASFQRMPRNNFGINLGYLSQTMNAKVIKTTGTDTTNMAGSGMSFGGFYEVAFGRSFTGVIKAQYEQFNVIGTINNPPGCSETTNCNALFNFLSLYGSGKLYLYQDKVRLWTSAGLGMSTPVSKSSTALDVSQSSMLQTYTVSLGIDYQLSRRNYFNMSVDMIQFFPSSTVTSSMSGLSFSYAWNSF